MQRSNADHYKSNTVTEVKVFEGRAHLLPAQRGWEEVADYALDWAVKHADTGVRASQAVVPTLPRDVPTSPPALGLP